MIIFSFSKVLDLMSKSIQTVIPAQAGIQLDEELRGLELVSRLRGNDGVGL